MPSPASAAKAAASSAAMDSNTCRDGSMQTMANLPSSVSVSVAPIGKFLTADPSKEGPFAEDARNLVRRSGYRDALACSRSSIECTHAYSRPAGTGLQASSEHDGSPSPSSISPCLFRDSQAQQADWEILHEASAVAAASVCVNAAAGATRMSPCQHADEARDSPAQGNHDPWRPFWLPDAELGARGAVMDIVTVLPFCIVNGCLVSCVLRGACACPVLSV